MLSKRQNYYYLMRNRKQVVLLGFIVIVMIGLFLPIKITYKIKALAKVWPAREWYFMRNQDDSYISELFDYEKDAISHIISYKFERGDIATIRFQQSCTTGTQIKKGDTIGYIHSYLIENEIEKIKNQIATKKALLTAEESGSKQSEIDSYYQIFLFAKQALDLEKKNFERVQQLYNDSIIPLVDFEAAENAYKLAEISVDKAEFDYESSKTGEKPAELRIIDEQIIALENEISMLEKLKNKYFVISPIDGIILMDHINSKIFSVAQMETHILEIPVKASNSLYLDKISGIMPSISEYEAEIIKVNEQANQIEGNQILILKAKLNHPEGNLKPGMMTEVDILCDRITLLTYLKRNLFTSL